MDENLRYKQNMIAQWAFDTRPILGRFHLWLEDIEVQWLRGEPVAEFTREISFLNGQMERLFAMTGAVTALGTKLFGRFGEGAGKPKEVLNQVKKDSDAVSAYAMSESLWYLSRNLPENHAILVSLGEGLMPKGGESPDMGSNPQLGFGRIYARPEVARRLDALVVRLLNEPAYGWEEFYQDIKESQITVWGAAIDTLENTSRFAKGSTTGPLTVLHLFDQPLQVARPYEGYMGNLVLPREVVDEAAEHALLINYRTPRCKVMRAIQLTYPGILPEHVHVWTLRGPSRAARIGSLWKEWEDSGAHMIEDGWILPSGLAAFTDSGTYAPTYMVGTWQDDQGRTHLFVCDGYAASAEAAQSASLSQMLGVDCSLAIFSSRFDLPWERERDLMRLDPLADDFTERLERVVGSPLDERAVEHHREMILEAAHAGLPVGKSVIGVEDFLPEKRWDVLAVSGYMVPDPYSGAPGVEQLDENTYRVTVRLASRRADKRITICLRLLETAEESQLVFNPLLVRFMAGEDYRIRPVKISDSGRIRNELQTLCTEALEFTGEDRIRLHFERILPEVICLEHQAIMLDVLRWYKENHPRWFAWLDLVPSNSLQG